jgi:hypothetical protein
MENVRLYEILIYVFSRVERVKSTLNGVVYCFSVAPLYYQGASYAADLLSDWGEMCAVFWLRRKTNRAVYVQNIPQTARALQEASFFCPVGTMLGNSDCQQRRRGTSLQLPVSSDFRYSNKTGYQHITSVKDVFELAGTYIFHCQIGNMALKQNPLEGSLSVLMLFISNITKSATIVAVKENDIPSSAPDLIFPATGVDSLQYCATRDADR